MKNKNGFTLIELLVVIAIISILSSMLLPTFAKAKESARKVVCNSNLKQVKMAVSIYAMDYDERFPVAWPFWAGQANQQLAVPALQQNLRTVLGQYAKHPGIWWCPTWEGKNSYNAFGNPNGGSVDFIVPGNGRNNELIGIPIHPQTGFSTSYSDAALSDPAAYPMLFCGSPFGGGPCGSLNAHADVGNECNFFQGTALGGTNVAFGDGHVKYLPYNYPTWSQKIYATLR